VFFQIDFDFNENDMNITFSSDCIVGDIEKVLIQYERKEKIEKLNRI